MAAALSGTALACAMAAAARDGVPPPRAGDGSESPVITVARASGPIVIDGDLSDTAWHDATRIDTFYEYNPGDNLPPRVRTLAWLAYDHDALYVAVQCDDPHPEHIRAPVVDRDKVFGDQDNLALYLDTRGDRRVALQLRVNPRGVQADALVNDGTGSDDFAPDFFYDTATRITPTGWNAEFRIPLRSLRFNAGGPQMWGFFLVRNYPREFRYQFASVRLPRGVGCTVCRAATLVGITGLPNSGGLVVASHATALDEWSAPRPGEPLRRRPVDSEAGLDVKWTPSADTALDAAVKPDFSQVESDLAQFTVNNRFALLYPEKRPFFLESIDLLQTPLDAVYTRTLTDPRWGARATGRVGSTAYTLLAGHDAGGGQVVLPRPTTSLFARQDFGSWAAIARARRELGASFVSLLATAREIDGGGYNRVFGPDFNWRPNQRDAFKGQFLWSETRTPRLPTLAEEWDGRRLSAHALRFDWRHSTSRFEWRGIFSDVGHDFRADLGFVPEAGYRQASGTFAYSFYPDHGFVTRARPFVGFDVVDEPGGGPIRRYWQVGAGVFGQRNLFAQASLSRERVASGGRLFDLRQGRVFVSANPSRLLPSLTLSALVGEDVDVANVRMGSGAEMFVNLQLRPDPRLGIEIDSAVRWLNVAAADARRARLFTNQVQRLKLTFSFTPRAALRLIGQYVGETRDPTLYVLGVARREGSLTGSLLFTYRLNWQTALYAGYGGAQDLDAAGRLRARSNELFLKLSYALQR